jgi:hypothetical protein
MRPTRKHRPAIWENMLGTVYARNDKGETRYFDYKHKEAIEFSGVEGAQDARLCNNIASLDRRKGLNEPRLGQLVLWVKD